MPVRLAIGLGVTAIAFAIAGRRLFWLYRLISVGQPAPDRFKDVPKRIKAELLEVGGQKKLLQWTVPGVAHAMTFWGFTLLMFTILEAYGALFQRNFHVPLIGQTAVLGFLEDFFAVSVLLALIVFTIIRIKNSPKRENRRSRFFGSHTTAAWLVLGMIALVIISLLGYRAAQVNTGYFPYGWWAFASHGIANLLRPLGTGVNSVLETVLLLINITVITGFLVFVAYSKHLHIFLAPINVATSRRPRALGALASTPDMSMEDVGEDDEVVFGAGRIEDFSWKQLLDMATCTECGRCQSQCPAWNTDKPLSPKLVIMDLRDNMFASADRIMKQNKAAGVEVESLVPSVIDPDVLWSCTTCGACVEECPVDIEHIDTILDMRRYEVLMESRFPTEAGLMLRNIENQGDPWGLGGAKRLDWTQSLDFEVPVVTDTIPDDIEYLYWVGCASALDERARRGAQATARMLRRAGVTFAVLGPKESCTGDPARRLGNEYLFQEQAKLNIETLQNAGAKKVIASCPHCFNTLANEYPALGGNFEVIHHSQLLEHLVTAGKLTPGNGYSGTVTYHDPCYLGRHNRVFDEPRTVIDAIPGAKNVEMKRCREKGFCCGAGGARMWLEENIGKRINMERTEEALGTGADVVSTACPYCMIMLDDAVKAHQKEDDVRVLDLSQLVEESLREPATVGGPAPVTESAGEESGGAGE
ncbi:MAG TPA: (Fe-S)-binding protein [Acidimicrobiales bacterium]|nr:(Fe-S)-binding protein [Acidimicrobiales bacterium]